jgi:hypothetical protein
MDVYFIINHHLYGDVAISCELKHFLLERGGKRFISQEANKTYMLQKTPNCHKTQEDQKVYMICEFNPSLMNSAQSLRRARNS